MAENFLRQLRSTRPGTNSSVYAMSIYPSRSQMLNHAQVRLVTSQRFKDVRAMSRF